MCIAVAGRVVRQEGHGGPFSSSPVFSSSRQRLYVAGLHGQITCFQMPAKMSPTAAMQVAGFEVRSFGQWAAPHSARRMLERGQLIMSSMPIP